MTAFCPFCGTEYDAGARRCRACNNAWTEPPSPTLPADEADEEVVYELDDWGVAARVLLTATLAERGIPSRWEDGLALVVLEADDEPTEGVLDEIEASGAVDEDDEDEDDEDEDDDDDALAPGEDEGDEGSDGGAVAQAAMADLFVAADRLMHEPGDSLVAAELGMAAAVVDDSPPPYGIDAQMWDGVRDLAGALVADLDARADEDAVETGARTLRDVLRPFV